MADRMPMIPKNRRTRLVRDFVNLAVPPLGDGNDGHVYVIASRGHVKIGWSTEVRDRLSTLQAANPEPFDVLAVIPAQRDLEPKLHWRFRYYRVGGEWFQITRALAFWITRGCPTDVLADDPTDLTVPRPNHPKGYIRAQVKTIVLAHSYGMVDKKTFKELEELYPDLVDRYRRQAARQMVAQARKRA